MNAAGTMTCMTSDDAVALGTTPAGDPVLHNWNTDPHLLIVGGAGTGKTVAAVNLLQDVLGQGASVRMGVPYLLPDYGQVRPRHYSLAVGPVEVSEMLADVAYEIAERFSLLRAHHVSSFDQLPEDEQLPRLVILLEEYDALTEVVPLHRPGDRGLQLPDGSEEKVAVNDAAVRVSRQVAAILQSGRAAGVNVVIVNQRASLPPSMRANLSALLMGAVPEEHRRMALRFPNDSPKLALGAPCGLGVYDPQAGAVEVQIFHPARRDRGALDATAGQGTA